LSDKLVERIAAEGRPASLPEPLATFEAYWQSIADPDLGIPYKRNFAFADIASIARYIAILDVLPEPDKPTRYKFRFAGTWHLDSFGVEMTGKYLDELRRGESLDRILQAYKTIADSGALHYWRRQSVMEAREYLIYARVMGPLADDDGNVAQLAGCFVRD